MTLEDCTLSTLNHNDLKAAYRDFPEFNFHMRVLAELNARFTEEFLHVLRNYSAHARYTWLLERFPDFSKRIPPSISLHISALLSNLSLELGGKSLVKMKVCATLLPSHLEGRFIFLLSLRVWLSIALLEQETEQTLLFQDY